MMETATKLCWALLALIHASPAAVLFAPDLTRRLYGVDAEDAIGVLLVHRGALFLAVVVACAYALVYLSARRPASIVVAISIIGFLVVYARAGMPFALQGIAIADLVALVPLAFVLVSAWRGQAM